MDRPEWPEVPIETGVPTLVAMFTSSSAVHLALAAAALTFFLANPIVVTTHELGHVAADIIARIHPYRLRLGPFIVDCDARRVTIDPEWQRYNTIARRFCLLTCAFSGRTSAYLPPGATHWLRARWCVSLLGGVVANAILCAMLIRIANLHLWPTDWGHSAHNIGNGFWVGIVVYLAIDVLKNLFGDFIFRKTRTSDGGIAWSLVRSQPLPHEATGRDDDGPRTPPRGRSE